MKRFLLFAVAVLAFVGCNNHFEDAQSARPVENTLPTFTAGFEDVTRAYVEHNTYLRWHEGDRLTIFYGNTLNRQYVFDGKTGDNSGSFTHVPSGNIETGNSFDHIYAIYPYDAAISLADYDKQISLMLPAEQAYAEQSFGKDANTMVAVTESVEDTFLSFKNVCGYLKVKLYGDGWVKSIELKGNNGEKIAGAATVTMAYGDAPKVAVATGAKNSITLDCGEGVALSADAEKPTEFWFVVPPTTFKKGITITATDAYGSVFEQSTTNEVVVARNEIQPMASIEAQFDEVAKPANNEIWYTATEKVVPYYDDALIFGANVVSNVWDNETKRGIISFDGNVTMIGDSAFSRCDNLTSVTIPDSVITIGDDAFFFCNRLTAFKGKFAEDNGRILVVDGVLKSFAPAGITEYDIPDSVTTIGYQAFAAPYGYTSSLKSVTIPDSVTTIGNYAFSYCKNLTSVTVGDSVTTIGEGAFNWCENLTSVTIGDSVTTIEYCAFYQCQSLTSVTIPDSVTTIENSAFSSCISLTSVTIPDSVTTFGEGAFRWCENLTSVTIGNSVTTIGASAFDSCESLMSVTIGDSVTAIGERAFAECASLKSVTIPDSVTTIGDDAFYGCDRLTAFKGKFAEDNGRILIVDGVLKAFALRCGATEYSIPNSVTTIGSSAFRYCTSLTSVTIPNSVTTIGEYAFSGCSKLNKVYCMAITPPSLNFFFLDCTVFGGTNIQYIYVPTESVNAYKAASGWKDFADYIEGYDFAE